MSNRAAVALSLLVVAIAVAGLTARAGLMPGLLAGAGLSVGLGLWVGGRASGSAQRAARALTTMTRELQQQIAQLTAQRGELTAIVDSMAEGVIAVDARGTLLLVNAVARAVLDLPAGDLVGRPAGEVIRHPPLQEALRRLLTERQRATVEMRLFHPAELVLRIQGAPCQESADALGPAAVLVIQDVTELHRYDLLRKEFVANVSHELKSPLTGIRSLTETLLGGAVDDPANSRRFLQLIDAESARLAGLVEDLLALSQLESGALPLHQRRMELEPMARSLLTSFEPQLAPRRVSVSLAVPPSLAVQADPERLRQILSNLLDNAIKYNQEGGRITIGAAREGEWVRVDVSDTGIGIPAPDLPRVFERFYRVDKARSRELGGTGLGLAIVKHAVEAHGGRVWADSTPQHGSTFSFTLPASV